MLSGNAKQEKQEMSMIHKLTASPARTLLVCTFSALCAVGSQAHAQTPAETFAKAKRLEIQNASAKQALPLYELVAQDANATDTMKARALYRLSICYLKLEEYAKATASLTRLEKSYPRSDQAVQARLLRKTLGASEKALTPRRDLEHEIQELLVAPTRAPTRQAMIHATKATLISLQFIGSSGNAVLRKALDNSNDRIQRMALAALVDNGDATAFDFLVEQARVSDFPRQQSYIERSYQSMLVQLCEKVPALWLHLRDAYRSSTGSAKARLLLAISKAGRLDLAPDYADHLADENELLRDAAWKTFKASRNRESRADCQAYVERLLKLLKAHPDFRDSMALRLVQAYDLAKVAGDPVETRWAEVLLQVAKAGASGVDRDITIALQNTEDLGIPLRRALLNMSSSKYFGNALAYRWPGPKAANVDKRKEARVASRLLDLAFAEFEVAWPSHPGHANRILHECWQLSTRLDLESWKAYMGRLVDKKVLDGLSGIEDDKTLASFESAFCEQFSSGLDQDWYQARIPWLLATCKAIDHPLIRYAVFQAIQNALESSCSLTAGQMAALKQVVFRSQDGDLGPSRFERRARDWAMALLKRLLGRKDGLSLAEALTRLVFTNNNRQPGNLTRVLVRSYKAGQLDSEVQRLAKLASVPVCNILRCVGYSEMSRSAKSAALREVWKRAEREEKREILQRLPSADENLEFIRKCMADPDLAAWENGLIAWIQRYTGKDRVSLYVQLLPHLSPGWKVRACEALQSLADPAAAPGLIELLTYPDTKVREAAEKALEAIRNLDKNRKAWRDWYEGLEKESRSKKAPVKK